MASSSLALRRLAWIREKVISGHRTSLSVSSNVEARTQKVKFLIEHNNTVGLNAEQTCMLRFLDGLSELLIEHVITDKGHTHSAGKSCVCFWLKDIEHVRSRAEDGELNTLNMPVDNSFEHDTVLLPPPAPPPLPVLEAPFLQSGTNLENKIDETLATQLGIAKKLDNIQVICSHIHTSGYMLYDIQSSSMATLDDLSQTRDKLDKLQDSILQIHEKLDTAQGLQHGLANRFDDTNGRFADLDKGLAQFGEHVTGRLASLENTAEDKIDSGATNINNRLASLEITLDERLHAMNLDGRFASLEDQLDNIREAVDNSDTDLNSVEENRERWARLGGRHVGILMRPEFLGNTTSVGTQTISQTIRRIGDRHHNLQR